MCKYCQKGGWHIPLDKNGHVVIFDTPYENMLYINLYGHKMKIIINYCPMCR